MSLTDMVQKKVSQLEAEASQAGALIEAERLADMFADIKPTPYSVPIERYVGMKVECRFKGAVVSQSPTEF